MGLTYVHITEGGSMKKKRIIASVLTLGLIDGLVLSGCGKAEVVDSEVDFHTDLMAAYIADDLNNIADYAVGDEEKSIPNPIVLDFSDDISDEADSYVIEIADNEKFENSKIISGLAETSYSYINPLLGEDIYFRGATSEDSLKKARTIHHYHVTETGPRNLIVDGLTNVRDIGGKESSLVEGGYIKQGLYYRGAAFDDITDEGKEEIYDHLGVRAEIDLRDEALCNGPYMDGVEYYAISIPSGTEPTRFEEFADEYCEIFDIISNAGEKPVYLHCKAGADRTGICTFMLLTVCGASYEDIARDYLFTNFSTHGQRTLDSEFENWWNKLDNFEGDTKADKAKSWMMSKGIPEETVEKIRATFVEGYEAE